MSVNISYSFSPTTTIESSQVNQNFTDLVNYINNTVAVAGMVTGWKGAVVDIPTGWTLDNDLKDRMVIGAGNLYNPGVNGGATTINLAHTHTGPNHTHTGPNHNHSMPELVRAAGARANDSGFSIGDYYTAASTTGAGGTGNTGASGTGSTSSALSSTQSNMPPYYALCWIRKT